MDKQYDITKWPASKNLFAYQFFLTDHDIPGWHVREKVVFEEMRTGQQTNYYLENKATKDEVIKVDAFEFTSWKEAHENMLHQLHEHMAPSLPELQGRNGNLGDVAYTGFGETVQHLLLVKANLLFIINSIGKRNVSVSEVARALDRTLTFSPGPEENLFRDMVKFEVTVTRSASNAPGSFELSIVNQQQLTWFKFFAEAGEFNRMADKIYYTSDTNYNRISIIGTSDLGFNSMKVLD